MSEKFCSHGWEADASIIIPQRIKQSFEFYTGSVNSEEGDLGRRKMVKEKKEEEEEEQKELTAKVYFQFPDPKGH